MIEGDYGEGGLVFHLRKKGCGEPFLARHTSDGGSIRGMAVPKGQFNHRIDKKGRELFGGRPLLNS